MHIPIVSISTHAKFLKKKLTDRIQLDNKKKTKS